MSLYMLYVTFLSTPTDANSAHQTENQQTNTSIHILIHKVAQLNTHTLLPYTTALHWAALRCAALPMATKRASTKNEKR